MITGFIGRNLVETLIDRTAGTAFGNMSISGSCFLSDAFDGVTNARFSRGNVAAGLTSGGTVLVLVGKILASSKIFAKAIVHGSNNSGYSSDGAGAGITLSIYGKNTGSNPVNATDGTLLGSISFTSLANESAGRTITSTDNSTFWDRLWLVVDDPGAAAVLCAELVLYEWV